MLQIVILLIVVFGIGVVIMTLMGVRHQMGVPMLFPYLAVLIITGFAGGLGVIFILANETTLGEWGVIAIGMALVVGVPATAALVQRRIDRR